MPRNAGPKPISTLFEKYRRQLVAPQGSVIKAFCELVSELYAFEVRADQVRYSTYTRTLTLKVPGPLKSEILLRKKEILSHLKGRLGEKNTPTTLI